MNKTSRILTTTLALLSLTAQPLRAQVPAAPKNIKVTDNLDGTSTVTWDPVTTTTGGSALTGTVTYTVVPYISGYPNDAVAEDISETSTAGMGVSYTGGQNAMIYTVEATATTSSGSTSTSEAGYSDYFFYGTPFDIPFSESFANGSMTYRPWGPSYNDTQNHFNITSALSADDDGGALRFVPAVAGDQAMIGSPKINVASAASPTLSFQYYAYVGTQSKIDVYELVNGQEEKLVGTIDFSALSGSEGWRTATFGLTDSRLKLTNAYARIIFRTVGNGSNIVIDNISVTDQVENNLEATLTAPANVLPGDKVSVGVNVSNIGSQRADGFNVNVYVDNNVVASKENCSLEAGQSATYSFEIGAPLTGSSFTLKGEAQWSIDDNQTNNTPERTVNIALSPLPPVNDLRASEGTGVRLDWSEPDVSAPTITESFETYEPFATNNIGGWTLLDRDGGRTYSWTGSSGMSFPGMGSAFAYTVFNPYEMTLNIADNYRQQFIALMTGHTGRQSMMSNGTTIDQSIANDDWLISPRLSGEEQTVTFWVKAPLCDNSNQGPESYTVWYSDTDDDPDNFTQYRSAEADATWQQVSIDLEEGTNYFAIQRTSTGGLSDYNLEPSWFAVDDVTYQSAPLTVSGYEIYRDGKLLTTISAPATAWTDNEGTDKSVYYICVIYDEGKSALSNIASLDPTAIGNVTAAKAKAADNAWYDLQGRRIARPSLHGIYIHNGKKIVR